MAPTIKIKVAFFVGFFLCPNFFKKGIIMNNRTKIIVKQALIATIYFVMTITMGSLSYLSVQFRYSEILNLLAFYNPTNAIGVTIGVFLSNIGSPLGIYDLIFGTFHTAISLYFISKAKNLIIASFFPTIFSFIIGFELSFLMGNKEAFYLMTSQVMVSEFIIMTIISVIVYKMLDKNKNFLTAIDAVYTTGEKFNRINI